MAIFWYGFLPALLYLILRHHIVSEKSVLLTVVSHFTCPDITNIPIESVHAPYTPVIAFVPPGPEVTLTIESLFVNR